MNFEPPSPKFCFVFFFFLIIPPISIDQDALISSHHGVNDPLNEIINKDYGSSNGYILIKSQAL